MQRSNRSLLALGAILVLGLVGLARAQATACPPRSCPMMQAHRAAAAEAMPCHGKAVLAAALDCCAPPPASAPSAAPLLVAPTPSAVDAELPPCAALCPRLAHGAPAQAGPRHALLHDLGLYTLHSVYRI
jgi:hypothetical protein